MAVLIDGSPQTFVANIVRNLVRIVDFMPTAYAFGLITMFCNRHARRLGDFAAGTLVIREQGTLSLHDLSRIPVQGTAKALSNSMTAPTSANDPLHGRFANLDRLLVADYELIFDMLSRHPSPTLDRPFLSTPSDHTHRKKVGSSRASME